MAIRPESRKGLILRSRIVWSRPCAATISPAYLKRAVGWLACIAFTEQGPKTSAIDPPHEILRDGNASVLFSSSHPGFSEQDPEPDQQTGPQGMVILDENSMRGL